MVGAVFVRFVRPGRCWSVSHLDSAVPIALEAPTAIVLQTRPATRRAHCEELLPRRAPGLVHASTSNASAPGHNVPVSGQVVGVAASGVADDGVSMVSRVASNLPSELANSPPLGAVSSIWYVPL